jgi:beta-lactamase superfamily II metal-dependent hydrolase
LTRTKFLKVGHHGSHNATPIEFVEDLLPKDAIAMLSTRSTSQWPEIPREPLLAALEAHGCALVRSDSISAADPLIFKSSGDLFVDAEFAADWRD